MNDVRLRISPPWVTYVNKLQALFDGDSQIAFNVNWSAANPSVTISTNNPDKAAALVKLLPEEKAAAYGAEPAGKVVDFSKPDGIGG